MKSMLALVVSGTQIKTREYWIPPRRLNKLPCERCALMAQHATWSVSGEGDSRYAFMYLYCDYCYLHTDFSREHQDKIEAYEQRRAQGRAPMLKLAKVVGM